MFLHTKKPPLFDISSTPHAKWRNWFPLDKNLDCVFCGSDVETSTHLFVQCQVVVQGVGLA